MRIQRMLLGLFSFILIYPTHTGAAQRGSARPNILFCFADDWGRYAGVYAALETRPSINQVVKTPNIDRIAGEGVLFRSPTKAWLALHRNDAQWKRYYEMAFAKRPAEELYDLSKDPYQQRNIAADPTYAKDRARLEARLMKILTEAGDPRVTGDGKTFERPPFTAPSPQEKQRRTR
jgi:arylsulfatase A-like enzyme